MSKVYDSIEGSIKARLEVMNDEKLGFQTKSEREVDELLLSMAGLDKDHMGVTHRSRLVAAKPKQYKSNLPRGDARDKARSSLIRMHTSTFQDDMIELQKRKAPKIINRSRVRRRNPEFELMNSAGAS